MFSVWRPTYEQWPQRKGKTREKENDTKTLADGAYFLGGYHHLLAVGNGSRRGEKKEKWHIMLLIYSWYWFAFLAD